MKIKTWRDPYEAGFSTVKPKEIELNSGITVLVGCNGAGKTTLINNISEECRSNKIPYHTFNNVNNTSESISSLLGGFNEFVGDSMSLGASLWTASEGEAIRINVGRQSTLYKEFLEKGIFNDKKHRLSAIFRSADEAEDEITDKRRVFLYDATDSGLSVDSVIEIKKMFEKVLEISKELGLETYIIISANEYELCRNEQCFDVNNGSYLTFNDYEDYRKFIIKSRVNKEKRIEKQIKWQEKQKQKEADKYLKRVGTAIDKLNKLKPTVSTWEIRDILDEVQNFSYQARFNNFEVIKSWKLCDEPISEIICELSRLRTDLTEQQKGDIT